MLFNRYKERKNDLLLKMDPVKESHFKYEQIHFASEC